MARDSFPAGVAEQLKWYVYRLIDPRNGETFYVGKGRATGYLCTRRASKWIGRKWGCCRPQTAADQRNKSVGLEVGHIIPHGMD